MTMILSKEEAKAIVAAAALLVPVNGWIDVILHDGSTTTKGVYQCPKTLEITISMRKGDEKFVEDYNVWAEFCDAYGIEMP